MYEYSLIVFISECFLGAFALFLATFNFTFFTALFAASAFAIS